MVAFPVLDDDALMYGGYFIFSGNDFVRFLVLVTMGQCHRENYLLVL